MLDIGSILFSLTVVEIIVSTILICVLATGTPAQGLKEMAGATSVASIAALVAGFGAATTNFRLVFPGLVLAVVAILLAARAMRRLQGLKPRLRLEVAILLLAVAAEYYFAVVRHQVSGIFVVISTTYVIFCGLAARDLLAERRPNLRSGCRMLGVMFGAFAAFHGVRIFIRPLFPGGPGPHGHIVLLDDITVFVAMAATLGWSLGLLWTTYSSAAYQLRAANEELDRFSGAVAHDLKAPLNAVIGFLEAAMYPPTSTDSTLQADFIASAHKAATGMNTFIHDLLEHARSVQFDPATETVDASQCLEKAQDYLRSQIEAAEARINARQLPPVVANALQVTRVFQNLLDNSLKYRSTERRLEIDVTASSADGMVEIVVRDNGRGIPEGDRTRIFNNFERSGLLAPADGHGIGLAECRRILETYGGTIAVESEHGTGTTFAFTLPAATA